MNRIKQTILAVSTLAITPFANSALITTQLEHMTDGGGFFGELTFEDTALDTVKISADIAAPINADLTKGDILGLWFDFADFGALSGSPTISGEDPSGIVTDVFFGENSIGSQLAGYSNVNLQGTDETNWDLAVVTGSNGGPDFYQSFSFNLTIAGLTANQFLEQRVGMRVQSIEGGSFQGGSAKLIGEGTPTVTVPEPGTLALMGLGILGLTIRRRSKQH
jgi:hypothetical protein